MILSLMFERYCRVVDRFDGGGAQHRLVGRNNLFEPLAW